MIYNVKINQIYITLVYSRDTISKKNFRKRYTKK